VWSPLLAGLLLAAALRLLLALSRARIARPLEAAA
jgi:hypothetical protein